MTRVRYTLKETGAQTVLEMDADGMRVVDAVRERMHPGVKVGFDPRFEDAMRFLKVSQQRPMAAKER